MNLGHRCFSPMLIAGALFLLPDASTSFRLSAQQKQLVQPNCPVVKVTCPSEVYVNDKLTFTADVRGGDPKVSPTYNWTVSAGSIASGQGTSTIEVNTSEVAGDSTVTATVDLGGFDRACGYGSTANRCTTGVVKKAEARKVDEYGKLLPKDETARLDNFTSELMSDPTPRVISSPTTRARADPAMRRRPQTGQKIILLRSVASTRAAL